MPHQKMNRFVAIMPASISQPIAVRALPFKHHRNDGNADMKVLAVNQ